MYDDVFIREFIFGNGMPSFRTESASEKFIVRFDPFGSDFLQFV